MILLPYRFTPQPRRGSCRQASGFTLVETALALGIVSFALVALMGTVPAGLQASRSATDLTVTTLIGERLTSMVQQTGWSSYSTLESSYYYFDDQGEPLAAVATGQPPAGALYTAMILPTQTTNSDSVIDTGTVAWLQIDVVNDPAHLLQGTPNATLPASLQSHAVMIPVFLANNGG